MNIVCISDTHTKWQKLQIPECDLLISCGDYSFRGEEHVVKSFHEWLNEQEAGHIISVQGNHEIWVQNNWEKAKEIALTACPAVHFMDHGLVEIEEENEIYKIFCSAWTPWFHNWAWNAQRGAEIKALWDIIPLDVDLLVTHGPPKGIRDTVYQIDGMTPKDNVGCADLFDKILQCPKLKHHFFGHIHGSAGHTQFMSKDFWNTSICDEMYMPSNPITEVSFFK